MHQIINSIHLLPHFIFLSGQSYTELYTLKLSQSNRNVGDWQQGLYMKQLQYPDNSKWKSTPTVIKAPMNIPNYKGPHSVVTYLELGNMQ